MRLLEEGLSEQIRVDSAGTHVLDDGLSPTQEAIDVAMSHGVHISSLRSRLIRVTDMKEFDYVVVMEQAHIRHLRHLCTPEQQHGLHRLMAFGRGSDREIDVPDPYGRSTRHYEKSWSLIEDGVNGLVASLAESLQAQLQD